MINTHKVQHEAWKERTEEKIKLNHFMHAIGLKTTVLEAGYMEAELEFAEMHRQQNNLLHGGVTATLCDIVSGFAAYTLVAANEKVFTVEAKVSYYRTGKGPRFLAIGRVMKAGKRFHFCESELYELQQDQRKLIAKGNCTMCVTED